VGWQWIRLCKSKPLFIDFALFRFFEFCVVSKGFVYDFSFAARQFGLSVFDDEYAVMLAVKQRNYRLFISQRTQRRKER
jgi:hypothetical protein